MATRKDVEDAKQTVEGLCRVARELGYKDPCSQLINSDGSVVGDLLYFFEDNPGAIEAVLEWVLENHELDVDDGAVECAECGEEFELDGTVADLDGDDPLCPACDEDAVVKDNMKGAT